MQTLHLRFRALRAILLGGNPQLMANPFDATGIDMETDPHGLPAHLSTGNAFSP